MSAAFQVALVGLGGISSEHIEKLARVPSARIAGVCDLSRPVAEAVAERFGVGPWFTDYDRMLDQVRPDAVHVMTPPQTHRELVLKALERGAHVVVEKPIAPTWDEYVELRDAARRAGRLLMENYNYLWVGVVREALGIVAEGRIGRPVTLDVSLSVRVADPGDPYTDPDVPHFAHNLPGGALQNFASHPASVTAAVLGDVEVSAVWQRTRGSRSRSPDELRALVAGEEASAVITITSHARPPSFGFTVRGTEGAVEVDVHGRRLHLAGSGAGLQRLSDGIRRGLGHVAGTAALLGRAATARQDYFDGFADLLNAFYAAAADGGTPPITTLDMDRTNRLVEDLFDPARQL